jgi:peptide/nickel transport system substrate-binding protein
MVLFFGFCGLSPDGNDHRTVFHYNESNGITSLDPAFARNLENMWAVNQLFDGLVQLDADLQIQPSIAQSWSISDDGLTYTFTLRKDVFFHDHPVFEGGIGRQVVADDVIYSFQRVLDNRLGSPGRWIFDPLRLPHNEAIDAPNDSTVVLTLARPFPPFLGMLTTQYANIVAREAVERYGQDFRAQPVGCGPFKFAFWLEDVALVFHKHPNYFEFDSSGVRLPYLDAVKISFVRDVSAQYLGLLQGRYHFMSGLHSAYKDELLTPTGDLRSAFDEQIYLQKTPFIKTDYLGVLVDSDLPFATKHPLHDVRVRKALSYATDRAAMARYLRNNSVYPATSGFIPRGMPSYDDDAPDKLGYDLDKAAQLLAEAGYPKGEGLPTIDISVTSDYTDLCEFLQHQWSKVGINVNVEVLSGSVHRERVAQSQVILFRKSWLADYADEENFLMLFHSKNFAPNGPNYTHYANAQFDAMYARALETVHPADRQKLYQQMDSLIAADLPVIPLYYDQVTHFIRKEVFDFETNPVNMLNLTRVKIVSESEMPRHNQLKVNR